MTNKVTESSVKRMPFLFCDDLGAISECLDAGTKVAVVQRALSRERVTMISLRRYDGTS